MKRRYTITEEISVEVVTKKKRTSMFLIKNNAKMLLATMETWDTFFCKLVYDDNYIVVYSRGTMANQIPLNIEEAYSIKHDKFVDMENKRLKVLLEYMFISRRGFDLTEVLSAINNKSLGLVEVGNEDELIEYLLAGSEKVKKDIAVEYIFKCYPILKKYSNLTGPISVVQYKNIAEEIGNETFWFHIMPLNLELAKLPERSINNSSKTDYKQIYISEAEFLKRKNDTKS